MNCSLSKFYGFLATAIGLLLLAIAGALIPYNVVGLIISIASVLSVSFGLIPAMRDELKAYDACMGPSTNCGSIASSIDLLGQAAAIISAIAFILALSLEIPAIAALATVIFGWIGLALEAGAYALKLSGIIACGVTILILIGLVSRVKVYEDCRNAERAPKPPRGSGAPLTSTPTREPSRRQSSEQE